MDIIKNKFFYIWMDLSNHGPTIQSGITCKEIPFYMRDSACRWFIVKKGKIFWGYVKHFWVLASVCGSFSRAAPLVEHLRNKKKSSYTFTYGLLL